MSEPGVFNQDQARTMWRALAGLGTDVTEQLLAMPREGREEDQEFLNGVRDVVDTALLRVRKQAEPPDDDTHAPLSVENRRQAVIEDAVTAAELVIFEGSDGTQEESDYLTASVAVEFVRKSHGRLSDNLLHLDLTRRDLATGLHRL